MKMKTRQDDSFILGEDHSAIGRIRSFKDKAKDGTKRVLKTQTRGDGVEHGYEIAHNEALREIDESPAFNSVKFLNATKIGSQSKTQKAMSFLQTTIDAVISPKESIKSKGTRKVAGKLARSRPQQSRQADLDFLQAHDELLRAESSQVASDDEEFAVKHDKNIDLLQKQIDVLTKKRESMRAAWVTGRHVKRVRVVNKKPEPFPDDAFFLEKNENGENQYQWERWLGRLLLFNTHRYSAQYLDDFEELPFDIDMLRKNVERLIIVSAPAQTFISKVRAVYRWECTTTTMKWMTLYFFLLHVSHIMTFTFGYAIYMVGKNYYYPTSLEELREGIDRSLNRGATAFKIGELMDRNGNDDWLKPLIEDLGPFIQIQISDLANLLEVLYNFYNFTNPCATFNTLFLLMSVLLLTAFTSSEYSLKVFWFIIGLIFFACWPISSRYPRYRLLVSPIKWFLWDIPTYAEWSFSYLQTRAISARDAIESGHSQFDSYGDNPAALDTSAEDTDTDTASLPSFVTATSNISSPDIHIASFTCTHNHIPGTLILTPHALTFRPILARLERLTPSAFHLPYTSITELSKHSGSTAISSAAGLKKLEVRFQDGNQEFKDESIAVFGGMAHADRDKAFNAIVGFSEVRWQCLQRRCDGSVL